jgi:hypothetical protein
MKSLLEAQIEAIGALCSAQDVIKELSSRISNKFTLGDLIRGNEELESLIDICIKYGRLQSTHGTLLKDVTES